MKKVVLVTGAASGIGLALSSQLAQEGWTVVMTDLNEETVQAATRELIDKGGQCEGLTLDVTDHSRINTMFDMIVEKYGRIDLVINSAGISILGEMKDMTIKNWKSVIDVNLWGAIYIADAAYKRMLLQKSGHIVNIASAAGIVPSTMNLPYVTSKHGVVGLTTSLRAEAKKYGIKASVVCPGGIKTGIFSKVNVIGGSREAVQKRFEKTRPMPANTAAIKILRGIERNKAIIPITARAHIIWRMYRYTPWLYRIILSKITESYRKLFRES